MQKKYQIILTVLAAVFITAVIFTGCKINPSDNDGDGDNGGNNTPTQFYVSPDGSNSNDGSQENPWQTIQYGLDNIQPGQTLNIMAGTYAEILYLSRSGSENNSIRIIGESFASVILDGTNVARDLFFVENADHIELANMTFFNAPRAGLRLSRSNNVEIRNCRFTQNGRWGVFTDFSDDTLIENCEASGSAEEHGIYISNSSDNAVIRGNFVHSNYAAGIQINADPSMGDDGISSNCLIENNLVYENGMGGAAAINLASVRDSVIQNNYIYYNYAGGIAAWDDGQGSQWGSKNLTIIHNTIYFLAANGRWAISLKNGSTSAEIYNNILDGGLRGGFEFSSDSLQGLIIDYNIYYRPNSVFMVTQEDVRDYTLAQWQAAGYDRNSAFENPLNTFEDVNNAGFHLRSSSIAVDMGVDTGLANDFEGDKRPQGSAPDVGADEVR